MSRDAAPRMWIALAWTAAVLAACDGAGAAEHGRDGGDVASPAPTATESPSPAPAAPESPSPTPAATGIAPAEDAGRCPALRRSSAGGVTAPRTAGVSLDACVRDPACDVTLVSAHRGFHAVHPENSVAALEAAWRVGADFVEVDVRTSADGVLVVMHDATVDRTTQGHGRIDEMPADAITALHLDDPRGGQSPERVPTFAAMLEAARGRVVIDLDWKAAEPEALARVLHDHDATGRVVVRHGDNDRLLALRAVAPDVEVMPQLGLFADPAGIVAAFGPVGLMEMDRGATASRVAEVHAAGARGWVNALFTVDTWVGLTCDTQRWEDILATGVDVVQTDLPELLVPLAKGL